AILRQVKDRQAESWTLRGLGMLYLKQGQNDKAIQAAMAAVAVAREIKEPMSESLALGALMEIWRSLGASRLAIFYGKRAVNTMQRVRAGNRGLSHELQNSLVKGSEETYHGLAELLIADGRLSEAEKVL